MLGLYTFVFGAGAQRAGRFSRKALNPSAASAD
jgi:hypothetical protein